MDTTVERSRTILIIPLMMSLLLTACGTVEFAYRRLDWAMEWYLEKFLPLDPDQDQQFTQNVDAFLQWHCQTQVARYGAWFDALAQSGERGLTLETFINASDELMGFWQDSAQKLVPSAVSLANTITEPQRSGLQRRFDKSNRDVVEYYEENSEWDRRQDYANRLVKLLHRWIGSLTATQKESIVAWARALDLAGADRVRARQSWQNALLDALRAPPGSARDSQLASLMLKPHQYWTPEFVAKFELNRRLTLEVLADLGTTLTPSQRAHFVRYASEWSQDMLALRCPLGVANHDPSRLHADPVRNEFFPLTVS